MLIKAILVCALICVSCAAAPASVKLNCLFLDGMVLQRGMSVPVWGTADDGQKITVSIAGQRVSTIAAGGKWMVRLKPIKAGGPYNMTISADKTIELSDILVGEVWVCSGQSNMEMALNAIRDSKETVEASADRMLRLFTVPHGMSNTPKEDIDPCDKWKVCGPDTLGDFSAVAYYFGRELRKQLGVPIGLINTSFGGTCVEAWTSPEVVDAGQKHEDWVNTIPDYMRPMNHASVLYNAMVVPLIPYAMKGVIWYQGESNAGFAYQYREKFPTMIRNWRQDWSEGDFPFLFVQLAPFQKISPEPQESMWAELRDAQLFTDQHVPNTAMAVITDCGDEDDIHPQRKEPVGYRLALAAQAVAYGKKIVYQGPTYKSMKIDGSSAIVTFSNVGGGLEARGGELTGFAIAGEDRKFHNAKAVISGDKVIVTCEQVERPVAVRFGWADYPVVNLFNKEGLPGSPFRTDDFPMITAPTAPAE